MEKAWKVTNKFTGEITVFSDKRIAEQFMRDETTALREAHDVDDLPHPSVVMVTVRRKV